MSNSIDPRRDLNHAFWTIVLSTQKTQLLHYVDDFVEPAVRAYRCVQAMARQQQNLDEKEVLAVKRRVKFRGFHVVTEELSEAEAEEDCGPREPISGGESEDPEESDTDDDNYVSSKPIGKVGDTTSVESRKSPRKQAQPSSPVRACTPETEEPTPAEEFGSGEVLHFRTRNDEMWFELLSDPRLELQYALETMRQYHVLQLQPWVGKQLKPHFIISRPEVQHFSTAELLSRRRFLSLRSTCANLEQRELL